MDPRVRKVLTYRDQGNTSQAAHLAHWMGFRWQTGPVIVVAEGPWGCCKVWASTAAEGQRVIRHAAAIGGWNPDDPTMGRWIITSSSDPRYGRAAEVGVRVKRGDFMVHKRAGPSGAPIAN